MTYTGCPRRNVPDFGRVFLMGKYTDITQNTYVQSYIGILYHKEHPPEVWHIPPVYDELGRISGKVTRPT
jgi:hypothetical protein